MSDQNIYLSNGTCYSKSGEELDKSFIPCGNTYASGRHFTCCGHGDNCLADNSCWGQHGSGYGSSLTYMAGCSDPDYKDGSCPDKKGLDQPWIALTLCDNTDEWAVCSQEGNPKTLQPGSFCSCTDASKSTVAFKDATSLTSICSLPQTTGQSIQFFVGHIPTASGSPSGSGGGGGSSGSSGGGSTSGPSQTGSPSSSRGGSNTGTGGSTTSSTSSPVGGSSNPSDEANGDSGLSLGAKIGIGVGVGVGALILIATIAALIFLRRRRQRSSEVRAHESDPPPYAAAKLSKDHQRVSAISATPRISEADGQPISEVDGRAARPWSMRSELEDTQVMPNLAKYNDKSVPPGALQADRVRNSGELSPVPELPGSERPQGSGQGPGWVAATTGQGEEIPSQDVGGQKPSYERGPGQSPIETSRPELAHGGRLQAVGPEGARISPDPRSGPEQGQAPYPGAGHQRWGQAWRGNNTEAS